jgi:integrase
MRQTTSDKCWFRSIAGSGDGPLFTNQRGNAWRKETLYDAIKKARTKANVPHAICYGIRHTWATTALANGVPDALVSALMGHQGTAMLHRHYSHLTSRMDVLKEAAKQVRHAQPVGDGGGLEERNDVGETLPPGPSSTYRNE